MTLAHYCTSPPDRAWRISITKPRGNNRNQVKIDPSYPTTIVYDAYVLYIGVFVEIILRRAVTHLLISVRI